MMRRVIIYIALTLGLLSAQFGTAGTETLFKMGYGGRSLGMGRAFTAIANDNSAIFYNPAGMELIQRKQVGFFHMGLLGDGNYDYLSFTYPTLELGTFGGAIGRWGVSGVSLTLKDSPISLRDDGSFEHYRLLLGYGKEIIWGIHAGMNFKIDGQFADAINTTTGDNVSIQDFGFGADIGILYKEPETPFIGDLQAGLTLQNLWAPQVSLGTENDIFPLTIRFGLMKPLSFGEDSKLIVAADIIKASNTPMNFSLGAEYNFAGTASIRAGLDEGTLSFGGGVNYFDFDLDYSYGNLNTDGVFGPLHKFFISYSFGLSTDEQEAIESARLAERDALIVEKAISEENENKIKKHFEDGDRFFDNEEFFNASVEYQQILSIEPFNRQARSRFKLADSLLQNEYEQEKLALAAKQVSEAEAKQVQEFIDQHYEKGQEYLKRQQYIEALLEFNSALERDPENRIILEARNSAQRLLDDAVNKLISDGRLQFRLGNYSEALRLLSEAKVLLSEDNALNLEIDQLSRRIQVQGDLNKGLKALEQDDYKLAAEIFKQALQTDPTNAEIQTLLKRAEGRANARKIILAPADERQYQIGVDAFLEGKYEKSLEIWSQLLDKYPYSKKLLDAVETAEQRIKRLESQVLEN
jgi:tetratricopeptide (TPR) repeat protein